MRIFGLGDTVLRRFGIGLPLQYLLNSYQLPDDTGKIRKFLHGDLCNLGIFEPEMAAVAAAMSLAKKDLVATFYSF